MDNPVSAVSKRGIYTICPEILSEIFLFASHSSSDETRKNEDVVFLAPDLEAMPCNLTRVCKGWRKVALSTPRLWSHIEVRIGYLVLGGEPTPTSVTEDAEHEKEYIEHMEMVFTWLRLSQQAPLTLRLCIFGSHGLPEKLVETVDRWRTLHLIQSKRMPSVATVLGSILEDFLPQRANNLQRLELGSASGFHFFGSNQLHVKGLPNLKHLKGLTRLGEPDVLISEDLHLLESIYGSFNVKELRQYLNLLEHLKILDVEICVGFGRTVGEALDHPATSHLETLKVSGFLCALYTFFSDLNLPSLKTAEIIIGYANILAIPEGQAEWIGPMLGLLRTFFEKHSQNLTRLTLAGTIFDGAQACSYLQQIPFLIELKLQIKTTKVADLTKIIGGNDGICPRLTVLEVHVHGHCTITPSSLAKTLQARFDNNKSMRIRLRLRCSPKAREALINDARIVELRRDYAFTLEFIYKSKYSPDFYYE